MLVRPIAMVLVLLIVSLNFALLILPFALFFSPLIYLGLAQYNSTFVLHFLQGTLWLVSFLTIVYFLLDFVFGFTVSFYTMKFKKYERHKEYKDLLQKPFELVRQRYNKKNVSLLIHDDEAVNAFAIGGLRKKVIVLTAAIIETIRMRASSEEESLDAITGIIAHEMSHIVNADYLPGMIISINDRVVTIVQSILDKTIHSISKILSFIPILGPILSFFITKILWIVREVSQFFNLTIVRNIYKLISIYLTRAIEYRSDVDAAKACGSKCISTALAMIGNGYNSIFSSHPGATARLGAVHGIQQTKKTIYPDFFTEISNILSLIFFFLIAAYLSNRLDIWMLPSHISNYCQTTQANIGELKSLISSSVKTVKSLISSFKK